MQCVSTTLAQLHVDAKQCEKKLQGRDEKREVLQKIEDILKTFPENGPAPYNGSFFADRRTTFMANFPPRSAVVIAGGTLYCRNGDVDYPFRQENDFYYLTGFDEPDAVAVLWNHKQDKEGHVKRSYTLLVRPKDPMMETWTGVRAGVEGAKRKYGANKAYSIGQLEEVLKKVCGHVKKGNFFVVPAHVNHKLNKNIRKVAKENCKDYSTKKQNATEAIHTMRLIKTTYEIGLLLQANSISAEGHIASMRVPYKEGLNECEVEAAFDVSRMRRGAKQVAYPSIVAAGNHANTLHYTENDGKVGSKDLILMDAGAEYGLQAADVTRTWPVSGKFTTEQKAVYELVLNAQEVTIKRVRPGASIKELQKFSDQLLAEGMVKLGILQGDVKAIMEKKTYRWFTLHSIGHYLGMDVHDVHGLATSEKNYRNITLLPGMVITVEPGIYIREDEESVDPKWRGIGIRIEDDILVTENGQANLSFMVPKEVDDVERIASGAV